MRAAEAPNGLVEGEVKLTVSRHPDALANCQDVLLSRLNVRTTILKCNEVIP